MRFVDPKTKCDIFISIYVCIWGGILLENDTWTLQSDINSKIWHMHFEFKLESGQNFEFLLESSIPTEFLSGLGLFWILKLLRGYCTPLELACFVCYLKIINTFWKIMHAS